MFRLERNVPEVYVNNSRDFQLFCRLYDLAFNSTKYSIDSMQHFSDTRMANSRYLEMLTDKIGILHNLTMSDITRRYLLEAFPQIIRYKGSRRSFEYLANAFARSAQNSTVKFKVFINRDLHQIEIIFDSEIPDSEVFLYICKMITPAGFSVVYTEAESAAAYNSIVVEQRVTNELLSVVEPSKFNDYSSVRESGKLNDLYSTVGLMVVSSTDDVPNRQEGE